jgi:hypothetical protein
VFLKCSLCAAEDSRREVLCTELKDEDANMKKCVEKLKVVEANRAAVVSELKEALQEQVRITIDHIFSLSDICLGLKGLVVVVLCIFLLSFKF